MARSIGRSVYLLTSSPFIGMTEVILYHLGSVCSWSYNISSPFDCLSMCVCMYMHEYMYACMYVCVIPYSPQQLRALVKAMISHCKWLRLNHY